MLLREMTSATCVHVETGKLPELTERRVADELLLMSSVIVL